jgi:hypothetical protein
MIYDSLRHRLKYQHEALPFIIAGKADRLHIAPRPGKWSIHDNITHLAKYQPVFLERVDKMLVSQQPEFERYSAETDSEFESWRKQSTETLLNTLNEDRHLIYERITSLSPDELLRKGAHRKFGTITLLQWTEFFLLHEAHHLFTIFQLANANDS